MQALWRTKDTINFNKLPNNDTNMVAIMYDGISKILKQEEYMTIPLNTILAWLCYAQITIGNLIINY